MPDVPDTIVVRFEFLKIWLLDLSSFKFLDRYRDSIFDFKLGMACLATFIWCATKEMACR